MEKRGRRLGLEQFFTLEDDIFFDAAAITPRKILVKLREWGYLTSTSKGKLRIEDAWPIIEIQAKNTYEPLLALVFDETEY